MRLRTLACWSLVAASSGCSSHRTDSAYNPDLPTAWANAVSNTYFPLTPGTIYQFKGQTRDGLETTRVEVLATTRLVFGVTAAVVRDQVFLDGNLIEHTDDWYAEDAEGNVWYLGEESEEIENGEVIGTTGSWEWGVSGALPGIYMWADPASHIGEAYRQEFSKGQAEDWGRVLGTNENVTVPAGSFTGCIRTADWSGLGPGLESKYYCPQIGAVLETSASERVELVGRTGPQVDTGETSAGARARPVSR